MASPLDLQFADYSDLTVRHPIGGEPLVMPDGRPQTITLAGTDSRHFRRALAQLSERYPPQSPGTDPDPDQSEAFAVALVAACTVGWLLEDQNGGEIPFTQERAETLYESLPWLRDQCDHHMAQRERYLGNA